MSKLTKVAAGMWLGGLLLVNQAMALPDPTRVPAAVRSPVANQEAPKKGLQSVIIAPGRRAAIINGQTVEQGGKYGNARLIAVTESYIVLRGPQGKRVMTLFPGVDIRKKKTISLKKLPAARLKSEKKTAVNAAHGEEK